MPLSMAKEGERVVIKRVGGKEDARRFLSSLGFTAGSDITVVSKYGSDFIVNIKDSRVAISSEMANKIIV